VAKQHLAVAIALEIPVAVVITRADLLQPAAAAAAAPSPSTTPQQHNQQQPLQRVHEEVRGLVGAALKQLHPNGAAAAGFDPAPLVTSELEAREHAAKISQLHAVEATFSFQQLQVPVLAVSSVTGQSLPLLHAFLSSLQPACAMKRQAGAAGAGSELQGGVQDAGAAGGSSSGGGSKAYCPQAPVHFQVCGAE
jgi:hypothetical protein